ncbi:MAG: hypothetical protein HC898_10840 [Phycisphaerales bacterium]|nr:hypothetical protein [Phycisphaerales bacterium]
MVPALAVLFVLTSLALVMARSMRVEALAASQQLSKAQAQAVAQGALVYLRTVLTDRGGRLPTDDELEAQPCPWGAGTTGCSNPTLMMSKPRLMDLSMRRAKCM